MSNITNFLRIFGIEVYSNKFKLPTDYQLKRCYILDNKSLHKDWQIGESYGQVQIGNDNNYFQANTDDIASAITSCDSTYFLWNIFEPKTFHFNDFPSWDQEKLEAKGYPEHWEIPFKSGKLVSKQKFKYGIFEITAKVPSTIYNWPAIWLTGTETWPPEIDIVEFYNHGKPQYASSNGIIAQPNIHYLDKTGKHKSTNPGSMYVNHPDERFITYILHWEENFIKIYYDSNLVYSCTDKFILGQMNQPMSLILNNAVEWGVKLSDEDKRAVRVGGPFMIGSVKYYSK